MVLRQLHVRPHSGQRLEPSLRPFPPQSSHTEHIHHRHRHVRIHRHPLRQTGPAYRHDHPHIHHVLCPQRHPDSHALRGHHRQYKALPIHRQPLLPGRLLLDVHDQLCSPPGNHRAQAPCHCRQYHGLFVLYWPDDHRRTGILLQGLAEGAVGAGSLYFAVFYLLLAGAGESPLAAQCGKDRRG